MTAICRVNRCGVRPELADSDGGARWPGPPWPCALRLYLMASRSVQNQVLVVPDNQV